MIGFINLLKPCGMSSSEAVSRVRRAVGSKSCGHMGTLDPGAAGVLPVGVGKAARLFDYLLDKRKRYRAVFRFGISTDTLDCYGTPTVSGGRIPAREEIEAVLPAMCGEIEQRAPVYSAKKIGGRKGYELARAGRDYEPPKKKVRIYRISLLGQVDAEAYAFDIECGGGTYIRSVARDLAAELGTAALMRSLIRTQSGSFCIEDAVTPEELADLAAEGRVPLIPSDRAVADYPAVTVPGEWAFRFENGIAVPAEALGKPAGEVRSAQESGAARMFRVYCGGAFAGMGEIAADPEGTRVLRLRSRIGEALS